MNTNTMREIPLGRAGKYGSLTVDCSRFNDTVHNHVYTYGLRQILNDAIADKSAILEGREDEDAAGVFQEKAQRRLDTLYSGELRVRGESSEPLDPVDAEVYRMVKAKLTELARATPEYAETKGQKDRGLATINLRRIKRGEVEWIWVDAVADYEAKVPAVRKAAQRIVKERAAAGEVEI